MNFRNFAAGAIIAAVASVPAFAADLPVKAPAQVYQPAPAYNWSGLYLGAHGGYGWGDNDISDIFINGVVTKLKPSGGFGGVQLGYNSQFAPHWLIGSEIDFSFGDVKDDVTLAVPPNDLTNKFNAFGTARTRLGYVQDRWLVYGTVGAIWLRDKYTASSFGAVQTDRSQYHVGWVFGGGVEYAVDDRWSWKLEYLYAPFGKSHDSSTAITRSTDVSFNMLKLGVNYRFADGGASAGYMPVKAIAPRSNWNGSYVGLHGGYGWAKLNEVDTLSLTPYTADLRPKGGFGGFQGGYNWLFAPQSLLGIEIDSAWGDLKDNVTSASGVAVSGKIDNLGTARLRLGYLVTPDTLVYATGGAAYARERTADATGGGTKVDHFGWVAGAGVEYKFAPDWSAKLEYNYADLGSFKDNTPIVVPAFSKSGDLTLQTIKVGINYSGPVIERLFGGR